VRGVQHGGMVSNNKTSAATSEPAVTEPANHSMQCTEVTAHDNSNNINSVTQQPTTAASPTDTACLSPPAQQPLHQQQQQAVIPVPGRSTTVLKLVTP